MQARLKELCDMNEQVEGGVSLTVSQYVILRFVKLEKNMTEQLWLWEIFFQLPRSVLLTVPDFSKCCNFNIRTSFLYA